MDEERARQRDEEEGEEEETMLFFLLLFFFVQKRECEKKSCAIRNKFSSSGASRECSLERASLNLASSLDSLSLSLSLRHVLLLHPFTGAARCPSSRSGRGGKRGFESSGGKTTSRQKSVCRQLGRKIPTFSRPRFYRLSVDEAGKGLLQRCHLSVFSG